MKANGRKDKPGGWYQFEDVERDALVAAVNRMPVAGEDNMRLILGLLEKLRNKHVAPEPVFSSAEQVEAVEPKANM